MPAERTTMRQVREILRLKFVGGVPSREIARRVGVAASTVRVTIKRFQAAGRRAGRLQLPPMRRRPGTQGLSDWIGAHTRAFAAIGAVPRLLVPDNAKVAVIKACLYEPQVNRTYAEMAAHYGCKRDYFRPFTRPRLPARKDCGADQ